MKAVYVGLAVFTCGVILSSCQTTQSEATRSEPTKPSMSARTTDHEVTVPIVKEDVQVGKQEVQSGTARVQSRITEQPVEQQIPLREEHVRVEQRPADRAATPEEVQQAFQEKTVEMTETREEPVVAKQPRVTGEVTVRKEAGQRTETIRETVRGTEVQPQGQGIEQAKVAPEVGRLEEDFQQHYRTNVGQSGASYEEYRPAYHYGYGLATRGRGDWSRIEPQARQGWESQHPGTWNQFAPAIRYGWQQGQGRQG